MEATSSPQLIQTGPEMFEAGLAYRYQMPDGPGPYPTAVLLHGRHGSEDVMWVFRKTIPRPWFVIAPRAPLADKELYSWMIQPPGEWPNLAAFDPAVDVLARFVKALPGLYNADSDRIYLMGFSQGAAVALATAIRRPKLARGVAGLVGFAPSAPADEIAGSLEGLPVFWVTGKEDTTVPYSVSQATVETLRSAGADLEYHEYQIGHKMSAAGVRDLRHWFQARV